MGFEDAAVTPPGTDSGIDVWSAEVVAQVKWWRAKGKRPGRPHVQQLQGAADGRKVAFFSARGANGSAYTKEAMAWAESRPVALFELRNDGRVLALNETATEMAGGPEVLGAMERLIELDQVVAAQQRAAEERAAQVAIEAERRRAEALARTEALRIKQEQSVAERQRLADERAFQIAEAERLNRERRAERSETNFLNLSGIALALVPYVGFVLLWFLWRPRVLRSQAVGRPSDAATLVLTLVALVYAVLLTWGSVATNT